MNAEEFCQKVRELFPESSESADQDFIRKFEKFDTEMSSLWFESLAESINSDMKKSVSPDKYQKLFEFMKKSYLFESDEVKTSVDVSFTENLFWQVPNEQAKSYWKILPQKLKDLYVGFHGKKPA